MEANYQQLLNRVEDLEYKLDQFKGQYLFPGSQAIMTKVTCQEGLIQSGNFVSGSAGWRMTAEGNLEANNGNFRGDITGASGSFSGSISIGSGNNIFKADNNGIYLGNATFASAPFRVTMAGAVTATNITATGTINATGGYIGASASALNIQSSGLDVGTAGYIKGGQSAYATGNGFFLGHDGGNVTEDSYSESNKNSEYFLSNSSGAIYVGQSFTPSADATLETCKFYIYKTAGATGNVTAKLFAHSGTYGSTSIATGSVLATSDIIDASALGTSIALVTFTFSGANRVALLATTKYCITLNYAGATNVNYGYDSSAPTHGGNYLYSNDGSVWSYAAGNDLIFYVYGSNAGHKLSLGSATSYLRWNATNLEYTGQVLHTSRDIMYQSANTARTTSSASYVFKKEIAVKQPGTYRIKFDINVDAAGSPDVAYGRIYKNGVALGTERSTSSGVAVTFSEDLSGFVSGDLIQLYLKWTDNGGASNLASCSNFQLYVAQFDSSVVNTD